VTRARLLAFVSVVGVLVAVPLGLIAWNELKLASGQRIVLGVQPVDPEDPFRGQYVDLSYRISTFVPPRADDGQTVYVVLDEEDGVWHGLRMSRDRPPEGETFIRGRVRGGIVRFGIESFYVEEGDAVEYERAIVQQRLYAQVVLDDDGDARLDDLVIRD
jgi:uncharacterized membrane-anchored protein